MENKKLDIYQSVDFWMEKFQNQLFREIDEYLRNNKMTKQAFAKKLGVSKGYVSQVLNGNFKHSIEKLIQLSIAIEKVPFVQYIDRDSYIDVLNDCQNYTVLSFNKSIITDFKPQEINKIFENYESPKRPKMGDKSSISYSTSFQMKYTDQNYHGKATKGK